MNFFIHCKNNVKIVKIVIDFVDVSQYRRFYQLDNTLMDRSLILISKIIVSKTRITLEIIDIDKLRNAVDTKLSIPNHFGWNCQGACFNVFPNFIGNSKVANTAFYTRCLLSRITGNVNIP